MTTTPAAKIFLIDGMALAYRAHFAMIRNPRLTSTGFNTSAIFGFINTIQDILSNWDPTHLAVAFDTSEPTFRHKRYPAYKATRDEMPEDLSQALSGIRDVVEAMNIPVLRYPGYEADDVIGTLARMATEQGLATYMVTPDKDFAQLVSDCVYQYKPARSGVDILGIPETLEKWGVSRVDQVVDVLGLAGDSSDNIPGVPGIGPKTAQKLLAKYDSVEGILEHTDELKGKQKERLIEHADDARLSKELVKINTRVPLEHTLEDLVCRKPNLERLRELFEKYEFKSLGKRFFGDGFAFTPGAVEGQAEAEESVELKTLADVPHQYEIADSPAAMDALAAELEKQSAVCLDLETTSTDPREAEIIGIGFAWKPGHATYVPLPDEGLLGLMELDRFKSFFTNDQIVKTGQNLKYDLGVLRWHDVKVVGPFFDTMLAHYLVEPDMRHNLDEMAQIYLHYAPIRYNSLINEDAAKAGKTLRHVNQREVADYCCEDVDLTLQLKTVFEPMLKKHNAERVFDIECELVPVLVAMEHDGIRLDANQLKQFALELDEEIEDYEKEIYKQAGTQFNIDSPKQIGQILFDVLKIEDNPKKTKTGQYATSEPILQKLAGKHEVVRNILEYRQMRKLKTTYVDMLPDSVHGKTGRIHTSFSQAVTTTGRIASQNPNLQNIPIRTERGREIRKAFVASGPEFLLLSADYSQIELRIIAEISGDDGLLEAFISGTDVHTATAAKVFGVPLADVSKDMRSKSKMVNYGIAYGMSAFGLAQRLNISRYEAKNIIDSYFEAFPGITKYMETIVAFARDHGYVETLLGRRRYLRNINSRNAPSRQAAERNAINAPIQGTAADMIKLAMVSIQNILRQNEGRTRMLLQIHDELLFDLYREEQEQLVPQIREAMETAIPMHVPIVVDIGTGENWLEAH